MTLDPISDAGWNDLKALGHRMVDEMLERTRTLRDRPLWQPLPSSAREGIATGLPQEGRSPGEVYAACAQHVLPYPTGNIHPRFWGWVMSPGTPIAAMADMLAASMNSHLAGYNDAASQVEDEVLRWMRELFGFPKEWPRRGQWDSTLHAKPTPVCSAPLK
jgi:glutamate/tyrosine decarboxylase-like PLP-dependent enzyme